jgi:hypothetical protein
VSTILEDISTLEVKSRGLDVADFLIAQLRLKKKEQAPVYQSRFTLELQSMIDKKPALLILIDKLKLEEN